MSLVCFWFFFFSPLCFISVCCFQHFDPYRRKDTWKKMLLDCLFVSTMLHKCQDFFHLTFYNTYVHLHGILEEFLFELPFNVWIAQLSSFPRFVALVLMIWNERTGLPQMGPVRYENVGTFEIWLVGWCLEELQWTMCLSCFLWATMVEVF